MKRPQSPPELGPLLQKATGGDRQLLADIFVKSRPVDEKGRYLHWDELRHRTPPDGLTHEEWWLGVSISRQAIARQLPPVDRDGKHFWFGNVDRIQEIVHRIDQHASGQILADDLVADPRSSDRYLMSSLIEEAITSSQLALIVHENGLGGGLVLVGVFGRGVGCWWGVWAGCWGPVGCCFGFVVGVGARVMSPPGGSWWRLWCFVPFGGVLAEGVDVVVDAGEVRCAGVVGG